MNSNCDKATRFVSELCPVSLKLFNKFIKVMNQLVIKYHTYQDIELCVRRISYLLIGT